jgi:hypothetical protein
MLPLGISDRRKWPLLTEFSLSIFFQSSHFSLRRRFQSVLKFCMGLKQNKNEIWSEQNFGTYPSPLRDDFFCIQTHTLKYIRWCHWVAEQSVKHVQTCEQGPPSPPAEIICQFLALAWFKSPISNLVHSFLFATNFEAWARIVRPLKSTLSKVYIILKKLKDNKFK